VVTFLVLALSAIVALALGSGVRLIQQYEQGIVLRFGRLRPGIRAPGLQLLVPFADRLRKVSMQTVVMNVPAQAAITSDNVSLAVDAVVYYRVVDPVRAVIEVQDYPRAVYQVAQTCLRSVIGRSELDALLADRERVNAELLDVIDRSAEGLWGVSIERVEVKDVSLPDTMKRSMSRQAEAERERRARVIMAEGEFQASAKLAEAAGGMAGTPGALQLRLLQTVVDVAAEKNSTLVLPFPIELLRFVDPPVSAPPASTVPAAPENSPKPPAEISGAAGA
jgi:regulator of protease activity HflC (stomatin/prohibitin superfamily)